MRRVRDAWSSPKARVEAPQAQRAGELWRRTADDRAGRSSGRRPIPRHRQSAPLIASLWNTVQSSCESAFYSEADWERLRFELWYANQAMRSPQPISGHPWAAIQHGLTELLVSPA